MKRLKILLGFLLLSVVAFSQNSNIDSMYHNKVFAQIAKLNAVSVPSVVVDSLDAFGNSITVGLNASPITNSYVNLFASYLGITAIHNYGVSGTGVNTMLHQMYANLGASTTGFVTIMTGFNDVRRMTLTSNLTQQKTYNKCANADISAWVFAHAKSVVNASASSGSGFTITRTGTWTNNWGNGPDGGHGSGAYTNTTNDHFDATFTDSTVYISMMGGDGSSGSFIGTTFTIKIDGTTVLTGNSNNQTDGNSDGTYSGLRIPMAFYFNGLTNTSHTITVTNTGTGYLLMDYIGSLVASANAKPFMFVHAPHMDATGYATAPASATTARIDSANAKQDSIVATLPSWYPTFVSHTENFYIATFNAGPTSGLSSDHIHPNNVGHSQLFSAMTVALLNLSGAFQSNTSVFSSSVDMYAYLNGFRKFAFQDQLHNLLDTSYIRNQNLFTAATASALAEGKNFAISGFGYIGNNLLLPGVKVGVGIAGDSAVELGAPTGGPNTPFLVLQNLGGAANGKRWDQYVSGIFEEFRIVSDNHLTTVPWLHVDRSGTTVLDVQFPNGNLSIGSTTNNSLDVLQVYNGSLMLNGALTRPVRAGRDNIGNTFLVKIATINDAATAANNTLRVNPTTAIFGDTATATNTGIGNTFHPALVLYAPRASTHVTFTRAKVALMTDSAGAWFGDTVFVANNDANYTTLLTNSSGNYFVTPSGGATTITGSVNITGAQFNNVTLVSATGTYNATATDFEIVFTGSTATLVYPSAVTGRTLCLVNQASGAVTIPTTTIGNASTTTTMTSGQNFIVTYDGTIWRKIN